MTRFCDLWVHWSSSALLLALMGTSASAQVTITYTYDELGRLEDVQTGTATTTTFVYDPAGNRETMTVTGAQEPRLKDIGGLIVAPINGYTIIPVIPRCSPVSGCFDR